MEIRICISKGRDNTDYPLYPEVICKRVEYYVLGYANSFLSELIC